jgi:uncharacterized protein YecE (DUF72 family)
MAAQLQKLIVVRPSAATVTRAVPKHVTRSPALIIGCSGWQYRHWKGLFYPEKMPVARWFDHYATVFDTVEVNNTFYRLPEKATFIRWRAMMPDGFLGAIKASRFLTHMKKLKDPEEPLHRLFERAQGLGPRLGPVLYQLPARFPADRGRLEHFLSVLPRRLQGDQPGDAPIVLQHAIEFRDPSWYVPETFDVLERHEVALCLHDRAGSHTPDIAVGPFIYVRFHGPSGAYHGGYDDEALRAKAIWLQAQHAAGRDVYAYFNNDIGGMALRDAVTLRSLIQANDDATASGCNVSRSRAAAARSGGQ